MEFVEKLQFNLEDEFKAWCKLYKYLNSQGIKFSLGDFLFVYVEVRVVQYYVSNCNVCIVNVV